ncbi:magnesium and cobalt transport protein CorA [Georgenia thermotolerans]|uniref:Transporter n=1 Tax=Georgenia thermotolerans TaxID=527326 RepID=A0A7J5UQZ3_9MICO|nr:magnesium and cobalt transport protein CorA [Georgenia thermotolerans]KAE8764846.1 transporter [Georgenia thermotolerans]
MAVVDNVIYVDGARAASPATLEETFNLRDESGGMAWVGLYRPAPEEVHAVAQEFHLHPLAEEDTYKAHQRPKLERYGHTLFVVLHPARYVDAAEKVEFGELHVFIGPGFVVTVRHAESPNLAQVRRRMEGAPDTLRLGPEAVLYAILDQVVDEYAPVVAGLENDIDEIEDQLFESDQSVSRRIYELTREVIAFQRATHPLVQVLKNLEQGFDVFRVDVELRHKLRDVYDHTLRIVERADSFRALLQNALTVNSTLVAQRQNDEMRRLTEASYRQSEEVKRISSWAAILFAPTLVGTIYGMNFHNMPELGWYYGYPAALVAMVVMGVVLWFVFKRHHWL